MGRWSADDIPDLSGQTAVVTGANSGLGYQTALQLARHGAHVILACRDPGRGAEALSRLRASAPGAPVELVRLDLSDLSSVRTFAAELTRAKEGLDILVNNAGVMAIPPQKTADGFEMQFGTNHLGHFALTGLLLPSLLARRGARVVTVSSNAALFGRMRFDDLQAERRYSRWPAYAQSKLANQLFMLELNRRAKKAGLDLVSVGSHPGYSATNLGASTNDSAFQTAMAIGDRLFAQSDAAGALPSLYAACAADVVGGEYFGPDQLFGMRGRPTRISPVRAARDEASARRLWEVSTDLTGVGFDALQPA